MAATLQCTEPSDALGLLAVLDAYVICRIVHSCCLVKRVAEQALGQQTGSRLQYSLSCRICCPLRCIDSKTWVMDLERSSC